MCTTLGCADRIYKADLHTTGGSSAAASINKLCIYDRMRQLIGAEAMYCCIVRGSGTLKPLTLRSVSMIFDLLELSLFSQADAHFPSVPKLLIHPGYPCPKVQVNIILESLDRNPVTVQCHLHIKAKYTACVSCLLTSDVHVTCA